MIKQGECAQGRVAFLLRDIPMCPTANRLVMPHRGRLISTPELRQWKAEVEAWQLRHLRPLEHVKETLEKYLSGGKFRVLQVDCYHVFPMEKIFTKTGKPKKIDSNNRLKAMLDAASKMTGIDDKFYFSGACEKLGGPVASPRTHLIIKSTVFQRESIVDKIFSEIE